MPMLPPELIDAVIDHLRDDRSTLRNCSLAGRNLRPRAQAHLFRDISLENPSWCAKFYQTIGCSYSIPHVVRSLRLVTFPGQWMKDEPTLPLLLQKTVNLRHLMMFFVEWEETPALRNAFRALDSLDTLTLNNIYFSNSIDLFAMLRYWKSLRHLTLRGIFFKGECSGVGPLPSGPPTQLETLRILSTQYSDDASRDILNAFLHPSSPISLTQLKEFQIAPFQQDDVEVLRTVLAVSMHSLRHLTIDAFVQAHVVDEIATRSEPLQIHHLPSLTLEFSDKIAFQRQLEWWTRAFNLRTESYYALQSVHLIIRLDETATIASPAFSHAGLWEGLDDALSRPEMRGLREVKITLDVGPSADKVTLMRGLTAFFGEACQKLVRENRLDFKIRDIFQRLLAKSR